MKNSNVRVTKHPKTNAIVTANVNKPDFGRVMLTQEVTTFNNNFLTTSKRTAFIGGPKAALEAMFTADGQVVSGNIVKRESYSPFYTGQKPVQYPALNSNGTPNERAGESVLRNGAPYYIEFVLVEDVNAPLTVWVGANSPVVKAAVETGAEAKVGG